MQERLDGKLASLKIKEDLKENFKQLNRKANLTIIHYSDPASESYLKGRLKIADELNVEVNVINVDDNMTTDSLISIIKELNENKNVDGIMVEQKTLF